MKQKVGKMLHANGSFQMETDGTSGSQRKTQRASEAGCIPCGGEDHGYVSFVNTVKYNVYVYIYIHLFPTCQVRVVRF